MPVPKIATAEVAQIRQQTQYTCCATSIASALKAHGKDVSENDVNRILGAAPMSGATWEAMLATVQYFGLRGTLVVPATPMMLKEWTDKGVPVLIGWNPEGRPWSHASVVFDVTEGPNGLLIHVMDPNIPNPAKTTRVVPEDEFCAKWSEKMSDALIVRRPAMAVELEVSREGRQMVASTRTASSKIAEEYDCYKDYRAGTLTKAEYLRCLQDMKNIDRRQQGKDEATAAAKRRERYHYVMYAELEGLEDVSRWLKILHANHRRNVREYIPPIAMGAPNDIRNKYSRPVFDGVFSLEERAEFTNLVRKHPGLKTPKATEARVEALIESEALRQKELEQAEITKHESDTERARPYLLEPRYRDNWQFYTWADADYPDDYRWNYVDDDGVYVQVSARVTWGTINGGVAKVVVYKLPVEIVSKARGRRDENHIIDLGGKLVTQGSIRVTRPEDVIPRAMPFVLRVKGEHGFNDDDLVSQSRIQQEAERAQPVRPTKTVVNAESREKVEALTRLLGRLRAPADQALVNNIMSVYNAGGNPTEDQLKALRHALYRIGMRNEANMFRQAKDKSQTIRIKKEDLPKPRHGPQYVQDVMRRPGAGTHHTRTKDVEKGQSRKEKHRKEWSARDAEELETAWGRLAMVSE